MDDCKVCLLWYHAWRDVWIQWTLLYEMKLFQPPVEQKSQHENLNDETLIWHTDFCMHAAKHKTRRKVKSVCMQASK